MVEIRNFSLEQSGTSDQPILSGYAVRWNEISQPLPFLERFQKGAFKESIGSGNDVLALQDHDMGKVIGRRSNGTLKLEEDEQGLKVQIKPNMETSWGKDITALVERRDVTGMSIGFKAIDEEWERHNGKQVRNVNEADLLEVSVVVNPAYAGANIDKRNLQEGVESNMRTEERELRQSIEEAENRQAELDGKEEMTEEENKEYRDLTKEIREARQQLEKEPEAPKYATPRNPEREKIEKRQAFNEYLRTGRMETRTGDPLINMGTNSEGGYLAPEDFRDDVVKEIQDLSAMREICRVVGPVNGKEATYPKVTERPGASFTEEGDDISEEDASFDQVTLRPKKLATLIPVSNELLADSGVDVAGLLSTLIAEEFAETMEDKYINGDGSGADPEGILEGTKLNRVEADATDTLDVDDVLRIFHAVPAKYRREGRWLMSPSVEEELRKIKDGDNRYIFVPDFTQGMGDTILGRPVHRSDAFPGTLESEADVMAFGNFRKAIYIADSADLSIERSEHYGFGKDVTYFRAVWRTDIAVALADAVRVMKMGD